VKCVAGSIVTMHSGDAKGNSSSPLKGTQAFLAQSRLHCEFPAMLFALYDVRGSNTNLCPEECIHQLGK
jgi:hypothetical protein